ncbi:hypothetical protein FBEOM_5326 [Fusarium beomiforme]|uniref:MACPF domain-containing protein n=1 Tax=Fusarium beomiforme TaxID=44412 RepID=A0A9P5DZ37_9HYPO|nr:hypothetical protein FBEOM_5326 [Fusarium beomiforme]
MSTSNKPETKPQSSVSVPRDEKDSNKPTSIGTEKDDDKTPEPEKQESVLSGIAKAANGSQPRANALTKPFIDILEAPPFMFNTARFVGGEEAIKTTGSILSQTLSKKLGTKTKARDLTLAALRKMIPDMSRYTRSDKFCTSKGVFVDDESITITEYLAIDGAKVDDATGVPVLSFFYRATSSRAAQSLGEDAQPVNSEPASQSSATGPITTEAPKVELDYTFEKGPALINNAEYAPDSGSGENMGAGSLNENEWALVLRNSGVFYGWVVAPGTKQVVRAPKAAFQLRSKENTDPVTSIPDVAAPEEATPAQEELPVVSIPPKVAMGIPSFQVNDDSHIEITAHSDDFTYSMARSDFQTQSLETSASAQGWGVSASVSAGFASNKASTSKVASSSSESTLIARYLFPRCDVSLWPGDLEPTPELAELVRVIRSSKDIRALRRLHAEFGNLFCRHVTLGGRLMSTKVVKITDSKSMNEHKESFKLSVGASVSASFAGFGGGVSVKSDQERGSTNLEERSSRSQQEALAFEAVGGDTILATNPTLWAPTVGDHARWRVINRDGYCSLVEILSGIPGYAAVQSWFVQAVPALSRYLTLDEAQECKVRFNVLSPLNEDLIAPRLTTVGKENEFWKRFDTEDKTPIFSPSEYRGPAIYGYDNSFIGINKYNSGYNADFLKTEWSIVAPFENELKHGTRVIIRSCPFDSAEASCHMVVFRNAQGEFLPGMSNSDAYQYWRILKVDPSKKHIAAGDEVTLSWNFHDQTSGWRDFLSDTFGRRQGNGPAQTADRLMLKVPWPRFENAGKPTSMLMSGESGDWKGVNVEYNHQEWQIGYYLQDVRLRIDRVGNNGYGDAGDSLLNLSQGKLGLGQASDLAGGFSKSAFWFGLN